MTTATTPTYDPRSFQALTFHAAVAKFRDGTDTPRAYLERCLETFRLLLVVRSAAGERIDHSLEGLGLLQRALVLSTELRECDTCTREFGLRTSEKDLPRLDAHCLLAALAIY